MAGEGVERVELLIYRDELSRALHFSPSDLQENRAGRLSAAQRSIQLRAIARSVAIFSVISLLAGACVAGAFAIGVSTGLGILLLVLAATFVLFVGLLAWWVVRWWRDVEAGIVSSVEGFVSPGERQTQIQAGTLTRTTVWTYYWMVDAGQRFWVPGKVYPILTPGRHRLYFLPSWRRIVAAEPI